MRQNIYIIKTQNPRYIGYKLANMYIQQLYTHKHIIRYTIYIHNIITYPHNVFI